MVTLLAFSRQEAGEIKHSVVLGAPERAILPQNINSAPGGMAEFLRESHWALTFIGGEGVPLTSSSILGGSLGLLS